MTRSLKGLRILNTRPLTEAQALSQLIIEAGGIAIECPTIEIQALEPDWIHHLPPLDQVNRAIFVSINAVRYCFKALEKYKLPWPDSIGVMAIGKGTAQALKDQGISQIEIPPLPDSEHLLACDSLETPNNQTMILFKGLGGRSLIEEELIKRGTTLSSIPVYQRRLPQPDQEQINALWQKDLIDLTLVTSVTSLQHLFKLFDKKAHEWLRHKPCLVISQRIAQMTATHGMQKIILSPADGIIDTLLDYTPL